MSNQKADTNNSIVMADDDDEDIQYMGTTVLPIVSIDLSGDMPSTSAAAAARDANGIVGAAPQTGASAKATTNGEAGPPALDGTSSTGAAALECAICLQTCIHPARLPCGHIFCFLCIKGVAYKNRRCAMCRREIPSEFLDHPTLVNGIEDICVTRATEDGYQWYYEGRNEGWWAYDKRTNGEIEEGFKKYEAHKKDNPDDQIPPLPPLINSRGVLPFPELPPMEGDDAVAPQAHYSPAVRNIHNIIFWYDYYLRHEVGRVGELAMDTDGSSSESEDSVAVDPHPSRMIQLICGNNYLIDFSGMRQYRLTRPDKHRAIQRRNSVEPPPCDYKGVAGLTKPAASN